MRYRKTSRQSKIRLVMAVRRLQIIYLLSARTGERVGIGTKCITIKGREAGIPGNQASEAGPKQAGSLTDGQTGN